MIASRVWGIAFVLGLTLAPAWADGIAEPLPPPHEKVMTGTLQLKGKLDWTEIEGGYSVLWLTVDGHDYYLRSAEVGKVKADVEKLIGQRVTVTARVRELDRYNLYKKRTEHLILMESITKIRSAS